MDEDATIDLNDPEYDDPVCAEIRRIREEIEAEFNHDIGAMIRATQEEESRMPPELFGSPMERVH